MEDFNTNESQIEDSSMEINNETFEKTTGQKSDVPKSKKDLGFDKNKPIEFYTPQLKPSSDNIFNLRESEHDINIEGLTKQDLENYGNVYEKDNLTRMRNEYQSNWERFGNLGVRIVSNIVGGTISSLGSIPAIAEGVIDEIQNKDADFSNSVTELGDSMKEWAKVNFPNYRENPNESWDVKDPAFWFGGVESFASTLEFMLGSSLAIKGVSALTKLAKAESILLKAGINAEKLTFGTKVAAGAAFSRNAENIMESVQLVRDTKNTLLQEFENNPEKFEELKNSEVGRELLEEGRELTKENLASFIAGKAGWNTYAVNSLNIGFDALQLAPLLKGFNPSTRLGNMATSSSIKEANRKLFNTAARSATRSEKIFDVLNPVLSGIGRSASEGVEEVINYLGTLKGKNTVNELTGKKEEDINWAELTEQGFWGFGGGAVFEGVGNLINKNSSNSNKNTRLAEIQNRVGILSKSSSLISDIEKDVNLNDLEKKDLINKVKSELALDLGLRASEVGNVDLLLEQVQSKEFKDKLIESGISTSEDINKAIVKTTEDIILAEKLYKEYYNTFQTSDIRSDVKHRLINESVVTDFFVRKNNEKKLKLSSEIQELKSNDNYVKNYKGSNLESLIELEGLKIAKRSISTFVDNATSKKDILLSSKGKEELLKFDNRIVQLKEQVKDEKLNIDEINPLIISKQAEISLIEGVNNVQGAKIINNQKKETAEKVQKEHDEFIKKQEEDDIKLFNESIKDKTIEELNNIKNVVKKDKIKSKIVQDKLNELIKIQKTETAKNEVVEARNSPVNDAGLDGFEELPEFVKEDYNENLVSEADKNAINKFVETKNINELKGLTGDPMYYGSEKDRNTVIYARNKVQEVRENFKKSLQNNTIKDLNSEEPKNPEFLEFEIDEFTDQENLQELGVNIDTLEEKSNQNNDDDLVFSQADFTGKIRAFIPIFGYGLRNYEFKNSYQIKNGNIYIKKEYEDLVKTLLSPDFKQGTEIELIWDKDSPFAKSNKNDVFNQPFKIVYKGITLGYLPEVGKSEEVINNYKTGKWKKNTVEETNALIQKLELELPNTVALRKTLSLEEGKTFKHKIFAKNNGTIVNTSNLRSIKNSGKGFYALNSTNTKDKYTLINIQDENDRVINQDKNNLLKQYQPGKIYRLIQSATDVLIPSPLAISKLNAEQSKFVANKINDLLDVLNTGANIENEKVRNLKDEISNFIKVDRTSNFDKVKSFKIYPQSLNSEGKKIDARIEFVYQNVKKEKQIAVLKRSLYNGDSWLGIFNEKGEKITEESGDVSNFLNSLSEILRLKYHNVNFKTLKENKGFTLNNKVYKSYEDYLIDEEVLQNNIGNVLDSKGNFISNVFGFNHDTSFYLENVSNLEEDINKEQEDISNFFLISSYEKEFTNKDTITDDLDYRKNYSIYTKNEVSVSTIIDEILKNPLNNNIKEVASYFKSNISKISTTIQLDNNFEGFDPALYSLKKDTILIRKDRPFSELYLQQTVLHEISHAATLSNIFDWLVNPNEQFKVLKEKYSFTNIEDIKFKNNTPQYVKDFVKDICDLRNTSIDKLQKKYGKNIKELANNNIKTFYGLENPFEFISEIMVNPNFRNQIKSIQNDKNLIEKLYNKIIEFLNKVFGTNLNKIESDLVKESVNLIKDFIDKSPQIKLITKKDAELYSKDIDNDGFLYPKNNLKIYKKYNLLNKDGNVKIAANINSEEGLNRAKEWVAKLNESPYYDFKLVKALDNNKQVYKIFIYQKSFNTIEDSYTTFNSKLDDFDNKFSRSEIQEITETFEGIIAGVARKNKVEINEDSKNIETSLKDTITTEFEIYYEKFCPESCKNKVGLIKDNFYIFYNKAFNNLKKQLKINESLSIEEFSNNIGIEKKWDDTAEQQNSSQNTVTNQIKILVKSTPELDSTDLKFTKDGVPVWSRKKSTITGMTKYVDFNKIYPYMSRNLIGVRTHGEIVKKLQDMSKIYPSFAYIANELESNSSLLAQFETTICKKVNYDSYVTFINNKEDNREIWIQNELKSTRYDIVIADEWLNKLNLKIEEINQSPENVKVFKFDTDLLYSKILLKSKDFVKNKKDIAQLTWEYANLLGIDVSYATIENSVENSRTISDFNLLDILGEISKSIENNKKNNDKGRLVSLAKMEALYRFDVVENSGLDINGNLIYAIRNPSFITNWFNDMKSQTKEGKEEFENLLLSMTSVPEFQNSNWLWNDNNSTGFLNYKNENGVKIPLKNADGSLQINKEFVEKFNYHEYGGAKELVTKNAQKYSDFSDNDWKLLNLISYLNINDKSNKKSDYVLMPALISSDSGKIGLFELPKIKLNINDIQTVNNDLTIKRNSNLYNAVLNTVYQEVKRIQQSFDYLFEVKENILTVKKDVNINDLQQWYHYGKNIEYTNGKIDLNKTLIKDNKPVGKSLYFQNMILKEGDKYLTLNDFINIEELIKGQLGLETQNKINSFVDKFIVQQIKNGIKNYKFAEIEVTNRHKNIVDGSFESLIAEYILNHFILNSEQFLFFNGSIAEYKDKIDTNKRAKQLFTPGLGLSEEAMKIQYENGSFSDGKTFRAITLKDVKTTSKTIDYIINVVKDNIINEKSYTKEEISNFTLQGAKSKSKNKLENDVFKVIEGYLNINASDAQGYCTLDRWEMIKRGRGEFNEKIEKVLNKLRKGETTTLEEKILIEPIKGYYYGREYDKISNRFISTQIKYSTMPLIPSMVNGTELEKLMDFLNKNAIDEAFFESAHKVGAKNIHTINNNEEGINENVLKNIVPNVYFNKNYKIQLDTQEHLLDEENLLAVQISKLIIANINPNNIYNFNGKEITGEKLIKKYFQNWSDNIENSSIELLKDLNIEIVDDNFVVKDKNIQKILIEEVDKRGLSDNYSYAIELDDSGNFKLPLFINNMATKWESILTSLFTNKVTKQKMAGGSVVLGSRMFLDKILTQSNLNSNSYKWGRYDKNSYEVSSQGDKRFSALIAKLKDGRTIEEAYQLDIKGYRKNGNDWKLGKGKPPINDITKEEQWIQYKNLWKTYLEENPDLLKDLKEKAKNKVLTDKFASTPISQARALAEILNENIVENNNVQTGIQWSKTKETDRTLKSFYNDETGYHEVEVLLGGWNSALYKEGKLIDIDSIPDELKTMIGYRIPTTSKAYMTVFKVVGFLPEESKGLVITPDDMITQMGQDFDIDKWFIINKEFYRTKKGRFIIPKNNSKKEFEALQQEVEELTKDLYSAGNDIATKKLADDLAKVYGMATTDELEQELKEKRAKLEELGKYDENFNFVFNEQKSKASRNNTIFDIYHAILTNKNHFKEILTPSGYPNIIEISDKIDEIYKQDDKNINPLTEEGQRTFRKRNIIGKELLGIAANLNGFMAIAQITKMQLADNISFKFKINLDKINNKNLDKLINKYQDNIQIFDNYAVINFKNLGYSPDNSFTNLNGELIMEVGAEGVNAAADNAKDPRLEKINLSTYTYPVYHTGVSTGVPAMLMGLFIRQPIIKAVNDLYFNGKSLLAEESDKHIEIIKRYYQTELYIALREQGQLSDVIKNVVEKSENYKKEIESLNDENKIKDLTEKLKKQTKKIEDIKQTFKNAEKRIKARKDNNVKRTYNTNYLIYIDRKDIKDILKYNPDVNGDNIDDVFSEEELLQFLNNNAKDTLKGEELINYLKGQLKILEWFNKWTKAGQITQDMAKVVKTDGIGAGPTMDVTTELVRLITSLELNENITINDKPAILSIYPQFFELEQDSVYPPVQAYFNYSNQLSVEVLKNLFINQTKPFKDVIASIIGKTGVRNLNEKDLKNVNKFLNASIINDFELFKAENKNNILGVNQEVVSDINVSFEVFKNLSTANKVFILKNKYKESLVQDRYNILNQLTPILEKDKIEENGYHKLDFIFYKNEFTDDDVTDSIIKMYESGNEFEKDLTLSLVNYSFANGLSYGIKSFAKVIPSYILVDIGFGNYLKNVQKNFLNNIKSFDNSIIDYYFKNNWNNNTIIPSVKTNWEYYKDAKGIKHKREIVNQLTGEKKYLTKSNTPIWVANKGIITVSEKSLKNLPKKIKQAPYITLWSKTTKTMELYKKYSKDGYTSFNGNVYYYNVNKLGKDTVLEFTEKSMFEKNNTSFNELSLIVDIESLINNFKTQSNKPKTSNTSKETQEELINKCKLDS